MASPGDIAGVLDESTGVPPQWAGLSRHLVARIFACDKNGVEDTSAGSVFGPATDVNLDMTLNWQSPFENSGPEAKLPSLMAMIQSGQLSVIANAVQAAGFANEDGTLSKDVAEAVKSAAKDLEGRTGITKLNSRQVFSGMPPIKVTGTIHFRAWSNAEVDVMEPYRRLVEWALPKELAEDGFLSEAIKSKPSNIKELLAAMFPSEAPQLIGFEYGNFKYGPMVIEHIAHPLDDPMDKSGTPIYRAVQFSLATLTALDKRDVVKLFKKG